MKKILNIIICLSVLFANFLTVFSEENNTQIQGIDECLDRICLNSDVNAEIREQMQETYQVYLEKLIPQIMKNPDEAKRKMGIEIGDDEYEIKQIYDMFSLDFDTGVLISPINSFKYSTQYARAECFSYLLDNRNDVFSVRGSVHGGGLFSADGSYLTDQSGIVILDVGAWEYIKDVDHLRVALNEKCETAVHDIKVFRVGYLTLLYIKCETNEYLIKMCDYERQVLPNIKSYVLYKADKVMNAFDDPDVKNSPYSQTLAELALTTKPTYDVEGESLQADGLLKGNEKGLDLLKPLTRIEATAMLVRAMGYEDAQTSDISYFADIPSDNWGAKYANIAKDKGIAEGVGDDMFAPNDTITASQFATLILRNTGENPDWQTAIDLFVERGLITSEQAEKMDLFTRGDMAKIIYEARLKNIL